MLRVGIAFDLKADFAPRGGDADGPDDLLEEFDSEATVDAIAGALEACGHVPVKLGGGRALLDRLLRDPPDLVFNIAEGRGTRSREAHVPALCEMLAIPFTHADPLTSGLTLDKALAKRVVAGEGVPTPKWKVVEDVEVLASLDLRFPVIAKPAFEGSSIGIRTSSLSKDPEALRVEVARLLGGYRQPVLVEEFCPGAELTVGILGTGAGARAIGVMEIGPKRGTVADFVYSLEVKREWESLVEYSCPPRVDAATVKAVERVALAAYRTLGCRDVGRVDMRLDAEGRPNFIEVNPLPGLNPRTGDIVILAGKMGMSYEKLIGAIVEEARTRQGLQ